MICEDDILISFQFKFENTIEIVYAQDIKMMELFLRQHNFLKSNQQIEEFYRLNLFRIDTVYNHRTELSNEDLTMDVVTDIVYDEMQEDEYIPTYILGRLLKHFKFKSNKHKEDFIIVSNDYLVIDAIKLTAYELTDTLYFGTIITKTEIDFIKLIGELIDTLPKVTVLDYLVMDADEYYEGSGKDKMLNDKKREYYEQNDMILTNNVFTESLLESIEYGNFHDIGCHYVYQSFMEDCYVELTQAITIESYINNLSYSLKKGGDY